jgi:hypothetical protein
MATTPLTLSERIDGRLKNIRPEQALKTLIALPFWLVGWGAGAIVRSLQWLVAAVAIGYQDGKGKAE